jgi:hypothetical protein
MLKKSACQKKVEALVKVEIKRIGSLPNLDLDLSLSLSPGRVIVKPAY